MTVDDTGEYLPFISANLRGTKDFSREFRLDGDTANGKVDLLLFFSEISTFAHSRIHVALPFQQSLQMPC